jgi:hypothetical protein
MADRTLNSRHRHPRGVDEQHPQMTRSCEVTIGAALFLMAVGAILRFALTVHLSGVNLPLVGDVLMAVGALGLVISVVVLGSSRSRRSAHLTTTQTVVQPPMDTDLDRRL